MKWWFRLLYGTWKDRWFRCNNPDCEHLYALDYFSKRRNLLAQGAQYSDCCTVCCPNKLHAREGNYHRRSSIRYESIVGNKRWNRFSQWFNKIW